MTPESEQLQRLHELKSREQIIKVIDEMYDSMIDEDAVTLDQLQRVKEC